MKNVIQEMSRKQLVSGAGIGLAVSAAAMSAVSALFGPYGHPWPSLAWAVLACGAAVWVTRGSIRPTARMSELISAVEREPPRVPGAPERGDVSTGAFS